MKGPLFCAFLLAACACRGESLSSQAIKTGLAERAVAGLRADSGLQECHQAFCGDRGREPLLLVSAIENHGNERAAEVASLRDHLMSRLCSTGLFKLVPDTEPDIGRGWSGSIDAGSRGPEDWRLLGPYRTLHDGKRSSCELFLQIIDLQKGVQIWNDITAVNTMDEERGALH